MRDYRWSIVQHALHDALYNMVAMHAQTTRIIQRRGSGELFCTDVDEFKRTLNQTKLGFIRVPNALEARVYTIVVSKTVLEKILSFIPGEIKLTPKV